MRQRAADACCVRRRSSPAQRVGGPRRGVRRHAMGCWLLAAVTTARRLHYIYGLELAWSCAATACAPRLWWGGSGHILHRLPVGWFCLRWARWWRGLLAASVWRLKMKNDHKIFIQWLEIWVVSVYVDNPFKLQSELNRSLILAKPNQTRLINILAHLPPNQIRLSRKTKPFKLGSAETISNLNFSWDLCNFPLHIFPNHHLVTGSTNHLTTSYISFIYLSKVVYVFIFILAKEACIVLAVGEFGGVTNLFLVLENSVALWII